MVSCSCNNNNICNISHDHNRLTMTTLISEAILWTILTTFQTIEGVKVKNMKNFATNWSPLRLVRYCFCGIYAENSECHVISLMTYFPLNSPTDSKSL